MRNLFDDELTSIQKNEFIESLRITQHQAIYDRKQLYDALLRLDLENIYFAIENEGQRE